MTESIDLLISSSLRAFLIDLANGGWGIRREREAISFYAFRYLMNEVRPNTFLYDPAQIGIEIPVPQVTGSIKQQVCKDLVIWQKPMMTCWDECGNPTRSPSVIMEWKFGVNFRVSQYDVDWLTLYTSRYSECQGYSVVIGADKTLSSFVALKNGKATSYTL